MGVAKSHSRADLDVGDITANPLHDSDTLMTESLTGVQVVLVCTAEARMRDLNKDFIVLQGASGLLGNDLSLLRSTENSKCDGHCVVNMQNQYLAEYRELKEL